MKAADTSQRQLASAGQRLVFNFVSVYDDIIWKRWFADEVGETVRRYLVRLNCDHTNLEQ